MIEIDFINSVTDNKKDNFNCLLFRLIFKADIINQELLSWPYPVMVKMVQLYKHNICTPKPNEAELEFVTRLKEMALENIEHTQKTPGDEEINNTQTEAG